MATMETSEDVNDQVHKKKYRPNKFTLNIIHNHKKD